MTDKRFYLDKCCGICDNDKGDSDFTNMLHSDEVVELLNMLHEENQQLLIRCGDGEQIIRDLKEENEQLKQELMELHEICAYYENRIKELKME